MLFKSTQLSSRLRSLLQSRLTECGWSDQIRLLCKDIIEKEKGALTVDTIVERVTPEARAKVPDVLKKELLHEIRNILMRDMELSDTNSFS